MDPFGYAVAQAAIANDYKPDQDVRHDGYSPFKLELKTLMERLRARYGRRKCFRVPDVQKVIEEIRREQLGPVNVDRRLDFGMAVTPPCIDLTECDVVIE